MTISTTEAFEEYTGDGTTSAFFFNFPSYDTDWMYGLVDGVLSSGSAVINADQQTNPGGTYTFVAPPPDLSEIVIVRIVDITQQTAYPEYTRFPARDHEEALDKLTMINQQQEWRAVLIEEDVSERVFRAGDTMEGHLNLLATTGAPNTVAARKDYVDLEVGLVDTKLTNKADKSIQIVTSDVQTLSITAPSLADNVNITALTNMGNGLCKLGPGGIVPSEHLPEVGGGALTFLGLWDATPETLPPDGTVTGDAYLITGSGNLLLRDSNTGVESSTAVTQEDTIIWYEADNVQALPEGWYFYDTGSTPTLGVASDVLLDDSTIPITAANVQAGFEAIFGYFPLPANIIVTGADASLGAVTATSFVGAANKFTATDLSGVVFIDTSVSAGGDVTLYFDDSQTLRTVSTDDGGVEVFNDSTGSGYERVLTESDSSSPELNSTPVTLTLTPGVDWLQSSNIRYKKIGNIVYFDWTALWQAGTDAEEVFPEVLPVGFRPTKTIGYELREATGGNAGALPFLNGAISSDGQIALSEGANLGGSVSPLSINGFFFTT